MTIGRGTLQMNAGRITRTDKSGNPFDLRLSGPGDLPSLIEMYRVFSPRPASQGLPPENLDACRTWVKGLLEIAENMIARRDETIIGHAAVIPDIKGHSGEFVIFVHQDHRNLGVGTELTRYTLERLRDLGFDSIWLTVNRMNFKATKLYRKIGFEYSDTENWGERVMTIHFR
jgi:GNAT superfamily N-acetyltransferase